MKGEWLIRSDGARMEGGQLECGAWLEVGGAAGEARFLADILWVASGKGLVPPPCSGDGLVAMMMTLAMRSGCDLRGELPVSPGFLAAAGQAAAVLSTWFPEFERGRLAAPVLDGGGPGEKAPGVGCFFSGGVDSFYSLWKHREEITHLIFVHGFDVPLRKIAHRELAARGVRAVAAALGMEVIEVESDIRGFGDRIAKWEDFGMQLLIGSAHLLGGVMGKVYLPSTLDYAQLKPDVTHPYVDPLWSTPSVRIINDGGEADRARKIEVIATWDLALAHLRVCWGTEGELNCGRCEKCLRTQLALDAVGALDCCDVFAAPYEPGRIGGMAVRSLLVRYYGDTLRLARRRGADHLIDLLAANYRGMLGFELADDLHERAAQVGASDSWPAISRQLRKGLVGHLREHDPRWLIKKVRGHLPPMREPLFQAFWHCCKRWLLRRIVARRFGLSGRSRRSQSPTFSSTRK